MKKNPINTLLILTALLIMLLVAMTPATAATGDPLINEFVADHTGTDTNEFVEVFADPSTDYSNLTVLELEGDGSSNPGVIDGVWTVGATDASGYWTTGFLNNEIENGTITLLLVDGFSGNQGDDLDTDNDGILDTTPWTVEVDGVAVSEEAAGDQTYASVVLTAFYDGMAFPPGGASRIPNGTDTDAITDWMRNDFNGDGLPCCTPGTPVEGEAYNTPGLVNEEIPPPPPPPQLTIMEIQGTDVFSPYAGEVVETTGVVTAVTSNGSDMWIQDSAGDGNPATSDGIFVDDRSGLPDPKPVVGDLVRIIGEVEDQQFGTQLPRTIINNPDDYDFEIISNGNPLPTPVTLTSLPDFSVLEGIEFWVPLEGMLVSVDNAPVVAATSGFGEFTMLAKNNAKPGSGFFPQTQQILVTDYGNEVVDYNPERILVDDATLAAAIIVRPGDRVRSLVGVVDYTFGNYKLQPTSFDVETHNLPNIPASTRSGGFGNTVITTYNVENLFDLELNVPTPVDIFGEVGFDPGSSWGPPSTQDNTLIRKPDVCTGRIVNGPFDPSVEWDGIGNNNFSDLGTHTSNCDPTDGLIISEYIEGSSFNKALEIYNGTGAPFNLAINGVAVDVYNNGHSTPDQVISLSGTIANGDVFVLAQASADQAILAVADQTTTSGLWNGDDAIELRQGGKDDAGSTPSSDDLETQLTKLALSIELELSLPEIIVVQEIENQAIAQVLADRVNAATGTDYVATSFETSDGRGIEPGFLWDANRVLLLEAFQLNDNIVPGVSAAFGPGSASPGREPIVGVFDIDGNIVTIVGNHFKSKGGDDPIFGVNQPFIRITEEQRKLQAQVVRDFVNMIFDEDENAMVMVSGDLNDFGFSEPGEGPDNPIAILEGSGDEVPLYNLIAEEKEAERFSYVFDGNSQVLDHMLVSPTLLEKFVAVNMLHFNASYPSDLEEVPTTPLRASDHDPVEGRFKFRIVR